TFGDVGVFSFHCQKNITTLGEGGLVVTNDEKMAHLLHGLRHNGHRPFQDQGIDYWKPAMSNIVSDIPGVWPYNFSMSEMQAAIGAALYDRLDELNEIRVKRAEKLIAELSDFSELSF